MVLEEFATVILHVRVLSKDNADAQKKIVDIMKAAEDGVVPAYDYSWYMESVDHPEDSQ